MPAKIPQDVREKQLTELAAADGYTFVGWVDGYKNSTSKTIINCPMHGDWSPTAADFKSGRRCPACSGHYRHTKIEREKQMVGLAEADGYTFVGWVDGYNGARSKITINCHTHGNWTTSLNSFVHHSSRCPKCRTDAMADKYRTPQLVIEKKIREISKLNDYAFVGWSDDYDNSYSRIVLRCPKHDEWSVILINFLYGGTRCPGCAVSGYASNKRGTLYALLSDCESMIKIGISNDPSRRHRELNNATPFTFSIHRELHCEDGSIPPMLERMFHDQFPSSGLRGFDGATEWRQMSPDVTTWLDLLGAHQNDLQDLYLAEQRLLDNRAGRSESVPLGDVMKRYGLAD